MADSGKLLLVDGDVQNRDLLTQHLSGRGYSVEVAKDAPEALRKLQSAHYDLVVLDQMIPGMNGTDLVHLLQATLSPGDMPAIMVAHPDQSRSALDDVPLVLPHIQSRLSRTEAERKPEHREAITGLCGRGQFLERISAVLCSYAMDQTRRPVLIVVNLDGFRVLNHAFGPAVGDQFLIMAARRLKEVIGPKALEIAHIGGDEFGILTAYTGDLSAIEECANLSIRCFDAPFFIEGSAVSVYASAGIAFAEGIGSADERHNTPYDLLRHATLALHHAKQLGRNRFEYFNPRLKERAEQRMRLAFDLRYALERSELRVHYQSKVHLPTRMIVGFESLIRWQHPEHGLISPLDFIPLAEHTGIIVPIGAWVLRTAAHQLKAWHAKFPCTPPLSMNVNISAKQLVDPELCRTVKEVLEETGIPPSTLKLELTESALMTEIETAKQALSDLRALGVGLKLDDFGTGYSSLSCLRTLQFDSLKIDRSFIHNVASDRDSHAIVNTIVNLANALNMGVIAEGIESEDQIRKLIDLGCHTGQGFLFSTPVTAEEAEKLVEGSARKRASANAGAYDWARAFDTRC